MVIDRRYGKKWSKWFTILIASIFGRGYYLQYTDFLNLSDKESVIIRSYPCTCIEEAGWDQSSNNPYSLPLTLWRWMLLVATFSDHFFLSKTCHKIHSKGLIFSLLAYSYCMNLFLNSVVILKHLFAHHSEAYPCQ